MNPRVLTSIGWIASASACVSPRTEILVVITSDIESGALGLMQSVAFSVRDARGQTRGQQVIVVDPSRPSRAFPMSFGVVPLVEDSRDLVQIDVYGCSDRGGCGGVLGRGAAALVTQRFTVGFVQGETRVLYSRLSNRCLGVVCATAENCSAEMGVCIDSRVDARSLPRAPASTDASVGQ